MAFEGLSERARGQLVQIMALAAMNRCESEDPEKDEVLNPELREHVKREWVEKPLQSLASETITVMERLKDLIGAYTNDELGYWIEGDKFVDVLQGLINNTRERNGKIFAAFRQARASGQDTVERMFNETEICLARINSFLEIFRHEPVKARLTSKGITHEGDSLRYVSFALIRDTKMQLKAISHIAETGKVPLENVE